MLLFYEHAHANASTARQALTDRDRVEGFLLEGVNKEVVWSHATQQHKADCKE